MSQSIVKVIVDAPLRGQLDYKNVPELGLRVESAVLSRLEEEMS